MLGTSGKHNTVYYHHMQHKACNQKMKGDKFVEHILEQFLWKEEGVKHVTVLELTAEQTQGCQ